MKSLSQRVRAVSEIDRIPPYITRSQIKNRLSSEPNLLYNSNELDLIETYQILQQNDNANEPPEYKHLAPILPRYPILPREEEGCEQLPDYCPSILKDGIMFKKLELNSPFTAASSRTWNQVWMELNNTQLNFYEVKSHNNTLKRGNKLVKSYTLQYGDVGLANDYLKKANVIRVRLEGEQFLLECTSQEECIVWINVLQMAMDLSLPLEDRRIPKYRSIPRRGRRRNNNRQSNNEQYTTLREIQRDPSVNKFSKFLHSLSHQYALPIPRRNGSKHVHRNSMTSAASNDSSDNTLCPSLTIASTYTAGGLESIRRNSSCFTINNVINNDEDDDEEVDGNREENDRDDEDSMDTSLFLNDNNHNPTAESTDHNTATTASKWDPGLSQPSYNSFLRYAQRCLVNLPQHSPWINKPIVMNGKKLIVRENYFEQYDNPNIVINAI